MEDDKSKVVRFEKPSQVVEVLSSMLELSPALSHIVVVGFDKQGNIVKRHTDIPLGHLSLASAVLNEELNTQIRNMKEYRR